MWLRNASRGGGGALLAGALTTLLIISAAAVDGRQPPAATLQIGTSGALGPTMDSTKEKAALETLKGFIKDETGMTAEIHKQKDWRDLADNMVKGKLQVGVFQGEEYAWASQKHPEIKPLAMAVNGYRYPVVYVVTNRSNPAKDFATLKGQTLSITDTGQAFLRLFVERQCEALGKNASAFFSKITSPGNVEDALDDVVDGVVQATVVDRAALEAYKKRKPARFTKLKPIAHSEPLLPGIVAYTDKSLDETTRRRFEQGLINANRSEKGRMMLALFHLTGFSAIPSDFPKMLARMRRDYPEPRATAKRGS